MNINSFISVMIHMQHETCSKILTIRQKFFICSISNNFSIILVYPVHISISSEKHLVNQLQLCSVSVYTVLQISANQVSTFVLINNSCAASNGLENSNEARTPTVPTPIKNSQPNDNGKKRPLEKEGEKISPLGKTMRLGDDVTALNPPEPRTNSRSV